MRPEPAGGECCTWAQATAAAAVTSPRTAKPATTSAFVEKLMRLLSRLFLRAGYERAENPSLPQDAGVPEGVAARLRPDAEAVRSASDWDLREQPAVGRRDRVDDAVVAAREPKHLPVGGDAAHVR